MSTEEAYRFPGSSSRKSWCGASQWLIAKASPGRCFMKKPSMSSLCLLSEQSSVAWSVVSCEGVAGFDLFQTLCSFTTVFCSQSTDCYSVPQRSTIIVFLRFPQIFCWRLFYVQLQKLHFSCNLADITQSGQWDVSKSCWAAEKAL